MRRSDRILVGSMVFAAVCVGLADHYLVTMSWAFRFVIWLVISAGSYQTILEQAAKESVVNSKRLNE